jgi:hypothetical protein
MDSQKSKAFVFSLYNEEMTTNMIPLSSYSEVAKTVRNKLRRFSLESIVEASLAALNPVQKNGKAFELPWMILLVAKIALEDNHSTPSRGTSNCGKRDIEDFADLLFRSHDDHRDVDEILLFIRPLLDVQLRFQKKLGRDFLRWPLLLEQLPKTNLARIMFDKEFEMSPLDFMTICYAMLVMTQNNEPILLAQNMNGLDRRLNDGYQIVLERFSQSVDKIRVNLQAELKARQLKNEEQKAPLPIAKASRYSFEKFEFPWFENAPLIRLTVGAYRLWHPVVFRESIESSVHRALLKYGEKYTSAFSLVFEDYVVTLARSWAKRLTDEKEFKAQFSKATKAVECIAHFPDGNVLVEAKFSLFRDRVVLESNHTRAVEFLKRIYAAMEQGQRVARCLKESTFSKIPHHDQTFLIIVTNRQLNISSGKVFASLKNIYGTGDAPIQNATESSLPASNTFILSISEFELFTRWASENTNEVIAFLSDVAKKSDDPTTQKFHFSWYLKDKNIDQGLLPIYENGISKIVENLKPSPKASI